MFRYRNPTAVVFGQKHRVDVFDALRLQLGQQPLFVFIDHFQRGLLDAAVGNQRVFRVFFAEGGDDELPVLLKDGLLNVFYRI